MTKEINDNILMEDNNIKTTINYDHSLKKEIFTLNVI